MLKRISITVVMMFTLVISISSLALAADFGANNLSVFANHLAIPEPGLVETPTDGTVSQEDMFMSEPGFVETPTDSTVSQEDMFMSEPGFVETPADSTVSQEDMLMSEPGFVEMSADSTVSQEDMLMSEPGFVETPTDSTVSQEDMLMSEPGFTELPDDVDIFESEIVILESEFTDFVSDSAKNSARATTKSYTMTENLHTPNSAYTPPSTRSVSIKGDEPNTVWTGTMTLKSCSKGSNYLNSVGQVIYVYIIKYTGTLTLRYTA